MPRMQRRNESTGTRQEPLGSDAVIGGKPARMRADEMRNSSSLFSRSHVIWRNEISEAVNDPENDEQKDEERDGQDGEGDSGEAEEEGIVLRGVAMGFAQVAGDEAVVAAIGFPRDVEDIAEEGNGSDEDVEAEVDHHSDEGDVGDAAHPGGEDEKEGRDAGEHVAERWNEADESIEAETDAGSGDAEAVVEEVGEEVEVLVGAEAFGALAEGRAGRKNLGLGVVRHGSFGALGGANYVGGQCYNQGWYGGYSSAAERLTVAQDVVGSIPTSRPR